MKKAIIYLFSATGNTEKVTKFFVDELINDGVETTVKKIEDGEDFTSADYIGIAYPIHAFSAPENVLRFAENMPDGNEKVFFIKTGGECLHYNDASSGKLAKILREKGYDVVADFMYVMPYNMLYRHSDSMADKMYFTAKRKAARDADKLVSGEKLKVGKDSLVSIIFRSVEQPFMKLNGKRFKVDYDKCVGCNACVNNCPQKNIAVENGKFVFGNNCIGCVRCSFCCPKSAISIGLINMWKVNGKYRFGTEEPTEYEVKYLSKSYKKYFDENA